MKAYLVWWFFLCLIVAALILMIQEIPKKSDKTAPNKKIIGASKEWCAKAAYQEEIFELKQENQKLREKIEELERP